MLSVAVVPGFNVKGNVTPDMLKPVPVSVGAFTVTGRLPVDVKTTDCFSAVFTATSPNANVVGLTLRSRVSASNCKAKLFVTLSWLALSVTACVVAVHCEFAVNAALVAFAGTVTVAGTVTAALLLERLTLSPPLGAGELSVTVQASLSNPIREALLQESALSAPGATPAPLSGVVPVPLRRGTAPPQPDRPSRRLQN